MWYNALCLIESVFFFVLYYSQISVTVEATSIKY